jgi:RNA polymerase sigma factor (sigma-70 family)
MPDEPSFRDFMERIRAGDDSAAEELVRRYEAAIRLEVRMRIRDRRLNRLFDSADICQSVLASFFARAALGQYDLQSDGDLIKLLISMARNKVVSQVRKHHNQSRDVRRMVANDDADLAVAGDEPTPSRVVMGKELLQRFRERLTAEERQLADGRAQGRAWAEIAAEYGGTPQARSKQLARALDRVARDLGLGDED